MIRHTGPLAHDGYVEHSHEAHHDHLDVARDIEMGAELVNYVVEVCATGKPWLGMYNGPEVIARQQYETWLRTRGHLHVRLLRRVAVVTDEVLTEGRQGEHSEYDT